ncbi:unnamed protein product [Tilletia controversa]|uniref:DNA 3'-5' helicase n=1 Tax=Tilletia controversa TaxID=13291 RepID=A0A8X7SXG1_9BASI|nr:hypothetical protein CF328_g2524 [Tilletia controversa]KAE8249030.1 hypothetical protein A4X06_0g3417 [Tilletia controversa]CAD6906773.1 unnamed protein product [Tilletia controversa]CAD6946728.1 unnamed protein product [Tilletia controversa]CAD6978949.1 unnamed protein product [Tilletia controversa]
MAGPQNNLAEHIRRMGTSTSAGLSSGKDGRASTEILFRPASASSSSFQRHSSSGSVHLSHVQRPAEQQSAKGDKDDVAAPSRRPPVAAPVVPTKRPLTENPDRSKRMQPAVQRSSPAVAQMGENSFASTSMSRAVPIRESEQRTPRQPETVSTPARQDPQPSSSLSTGTVTGAEKSTQELQAHLGYLREKKEKIMDKLLEFYELGSTVPLDKELLVVQKTFLDAQIAETCKVLSSRQTNPQHVVMSSADGSACDLSNLPGPSRTTSSPDLTANQLQSRRALADLSTNTASDAYRSPQPKASNKSAQYGFQDIRLTDVSRNPANGSHPSGSTNAYRHPYPSEDAHFIDASPPASPQRSPRRIPVSPTMSTTLSARAAEKQRADDDDAVDFTSAAVMLRYHGPNASARAGPSSSDMSHPWSKDLYDGLRGTFKLKEFRENQLEAMNATLSGKDVFCLMPTGGGKSLCYQLPALLNSGKTKGVTVVISPLLSLIHDQVQSLMAKDIPALALTGEQTKETRDFVMAELCQPVPPVKLLYVTPEFVTKSGRAREIFGLLHRRKQLARFVIDEAHCVSQWGHDFRPDYKELGILRRECPDIPIMAMTATANNRVQTDVLSNLKIEGCVLLKQSFNRANLEYEVRPKPKDCLANIAAYIKARAKDECGIIYCLSRAACEDVASKLSSKFDIEAHHYHAGMPKKERMAAQRKWQHGEFKVIVATIAFGMGIDKADVRYVIHHTLPGSLEGYYQETGRAGRDGLSSTCILYFAYKDSASIQRLIENGDGTWEQKEQRRNNLHKVISFCMNKTDCRRVQVLHYFGEDFPPENCHHSCDNCKDSKDSATKTVDVTELAQSVVRMVGEISRSGQGQGATMLHCVDVFRGMSKKSIRDRGHDECAEFGKGSSLSRGDAERLFQLLLVERILGERSEVNAMGFANAYMQLGREAKKLLKGDRQLKLQVSDQASGASSSANRRQTVTRNKSNPYASVNALDDPYDVSRLDFDDDQYEQEEVRPSRPTMAAEPSRQREKNVAPAPAPAPAPRNTSAPKKTVPVPSSVPTHKVANPEVVSKCLEDLRKARNEIAAANGCSEHALADDRLLQKLATRLPTSLEEMSAIEGFDDDKASFIGLQMLAICQKHAVSGSNQGVSRASQDHFLSQFRFEEPSSGSRPASSSASRPAKKANTKKTATSAVGSSASSSIRPLGVSRAGRGSGATPSRRSRAF